MKSNLSLPTQTKTVVDDNESIDIKCKCGLGINRKTGRLQWCPHLSVFFKLLIVLPIIMIPVILSFIILTRFDGLAIESQREPEAENLIAYDSSFENTVDGSSIRDTRCTAVRFGLSETLEIEETDLFKDIRTSFSPTDSDIVFPNCEESSRNSNEITSHSQDVSMLLTRLKRAFSSILDNSTHTSDTVIAIDSKRLDVVAEESAAARDPWKNEESNPQSQGGDIGESEVEEDSNFESNLSGFHEFWRGEGSRESIRATQAEIMRQYMDLRVSPCADFYQYACGNWADLNPIPKDKAGYDTFEMLRESLDNVLRDLLTEKLLRTISEVDNRIDITTESPYSQELTSSTTTEPSNLPSIELPNTLDAVRLRKRVRRRRASRGRILRIPQLSQQRRNARRHRDVSGVKNWDNIAEKTYSSFSQYPVENLSEIINLHRRLVREAKAGKLLRQLKTIKKKSTVTDSKARNRQRRDSNPNESIHHHLKLDEIDAEIKAKYLFMSCMNFDILQKRGIEPLLQLLENLGGWPVLEENWREDKFDWLNLTANLRLYNNDILIVEWVGPDIKSSDENVIQFDQTSLGLPTRDYFLQDSNSQYLEAYKEFMTTIMNLLGAPLPRATEAAVEVIEFEQELAKITSSSEERTNVSALYKRMSLESLQNQVPHIDWLRYLTIVQERHVEPSEMIVIYAVEYMQSLVELLVESKPKTVANYLLWRFVRHRVNNLDDRFQDAKQKFFQTLFGREQSPPRWKNCVGQVNSNMGMALGAMFVRKHFDENSKKDTLKMTHDLQQAFREILNSTEWLDGPTKHLAEQKVNSMSLKIGYPDFILTQEELNKKYAGLQIDPEKYFENTINILRHVTHIEQQKLNEPVNKTIWQTAPAIVNAYYSRNKNQIMFPAGILQPPFYHRHFPRALNYGGIGVVIGHELTHGFDDKGRLFDRDGNIHKWWSDHAISKFHERARCLVSQYGNYTVTEVGIAVDGESTQGENIADNGGIRQAFRAYTNWLVRHKGTAAELEETLPGLNMTGPQLFFLNFAQVWCGAMRPEATRNKLKTAVHSPGKFRVIGTLSNSADFAREFHCPIGSPMNPAVKCSVW